MNTFHQTVAKYRECARHVRNVCFQPSNNSSEAQDVIQDGWYEVDRVLFNWIVLYPCGLEPVKDGESHPRITLRITGQGATVYINRGKLMNSGSWDQSVLHPGDCRLTFRQFFDFEELEPVPIDFNYVMAEISQAKDVDLNGRLVLIEWQQVEFEKA